MRKAIGIAIAVPVMAVLLMGSKGCSPPTTANTGSGVAAVPATPEAGGVATSPPRIPLSWRNDNIGHKTEIGNSCAVVRWRIGHTKGSGIISAFISVACIKRPHTSLMVMGLQRRLPGKEWHTESAAIYHHVPGPFPDGTPYPLQTPCKYTGTYRLTGLFKVFPHTGHRVVHLVSGPVYVSCT
jgi:hypothetical protein